jgi:Na+/H+-dicarboxylate symporter
MKLYTKILIGMIAGILAGFLLGPNSGFMPQDGVRLGDVPVYADMAGHPGLHTEPLATGIAKAELTGVMSGEHAQVLWPLSGPTKLRLQAAGVDVPSDADSAMGWVDSSSEKHRTYSPTGDTLVNSTVWVGRLFLALIKMVVVPLVFCSLVVGLASIGDFRKLGRIGGRTLGVFMGTTVVALTIGVTLANLIKPGNLVSQADKELLLASYSGSAGTYVGTAAEAPTLGQQLVSIVPTNPMRAMVEGDMLQLIFFAVMLGIALTLLQAARAKPVVDMLDGINEAMVMIVHLVMKLAPFGVATLLFEVVGNTGISVLMAVMAYGCVVLVGLMAHLVITYGSIIKYGAKLSFVGFLGAIKEALLVGFSTSSSSATLPVTMECCEGKLKVSPSVTSFVLPLGATVNMDGTALYQGVAAIFIAQIYGMDLTMADQLTIVGTATLASVGAAGVPGAGMVTLAMVLTAIGVPATGIALVIGVDRILDMFRTACNIAGDASVTVWMAKLEGDDVRVVSEEEDAEDSRAGFEARVPADGHVVQATAEEIEQAEDAFAQGSGHDRTGRDIADLEHTEEG